MVDIIVQSSFHEHVGNRRTITRLNCRAWSLAEALCIRTAPRSF